MIRIGLCGAILLLVSAPEQDPRVASLIKQLSHQDWVEQAKAAKELRSLGNDALNPLAGAMLDDSPAVRYWAKTVREAIKGGGAPATKPPAAKPAPVAKRRVPSVNPNFNPARTNQGVIVFICNDASHGKWGYEAVLDICPTCAKKNRFSVDHLTKVMRCAVCKVAFTNLRCDKCGQPKHPRRPAKMRPR